MTMHLDWLELPSLSTVGGPKIWSAGERSVSYVISEELEVGYLASWQDQSEEGDRDCRCTNYLTETFETPSDAMAALEIVANQFRTTRTLLEWTEVEMPQEFANLVRSWGAMHGDTGLIVSNIGTSRIYRASWRRGGVGRSTFLDKEFTSKIDAQIAVENVALQLIHQLLHS
jgi:hypothetical protein